MGIAKKCLKFAYKEGKATIIRDNIEIADDIPSERLGDYIDDLQSDAKKKGKSWDNYLDDLADSIRPRKNAFLKWADKFDENFIHHLSGDVSVEIFKGIFGDFVYIGAQGQGGHFINEFLEITHIVEPTGTTIANLANDIPFKANVNIKSLNGAVYSKNAVSSMFPKNWNIKRIQEEVAFVYENTVNKNLSQIPKQPTDIFSKYRGKSTAGFDIIIETDDLGNIMNAYPKF